MDWTVQNFARDLSMLNHLIERYEIPIQGERLYALEGKLQIANSLNFSIEDLEFPLTESIAGSIPNEIGTFGIFLTHNCYLDSTKDFKSQDPFVNDKGGYSFIINIIGYKNPNANELYSTIRLDRHITGGNSPKVCHPFYHIQFGGDFVSLKETGELMLLGPPRIAHPPLDLFLGIHFILDNFFNKRSYPMIKELFENYEYRSILERAQKRLWEPYFQAFSLNTNHQDYTIENIFPLYTLHA
jgi:hypothetical protein